MYITLMTLDEDVEIATVPTIDLPAISPGGRRLLDAIFRAGRLSQAELSHSLDLAQPTVARLLSGFADAGLVTLAARAARRRGHPSVDAAINPAALFTLGIALLGDRLSMSLLDAAGNVRGRRAITHDGDARADMIAAIVTMRDGLIAAAGVDRARLLGTGMAVSAFFTATPNLIVGPPALEEWTLVDFTAELAEALGSTVMLENDGAAAAIAEARFGIGCEARSFAYLHLTNGFGGAIVSDGKLFRGHHGNAGEFGGIWTVAGAHYPSLDNLLAMVRSADPDGKYPSVDAMTGVIDGNTPGVAAWLDAAVPAFSSLCSILGYALDPAAIVIGGRLPPTIADLLVARISMPRAANRHGLSPPAPVVRRALVEGDAVALGAALMPLERALLL